MRTLRPLSPFVGLSLVCLTAAQLAATNAFADRRNPLDGQPAIRRKVELRKLRFEITPEFVTDINQDYRHAFGIGGNLEFHITDWLGIGVQGSYTFNTNTALESQVESQLGPGPYKGPQPTLSIHEQRILNIKALLGVYASITPFSGKFALFSAAFARYDLYVKGGLGMVDYVQSPPCCSYQITVNPAGTIGDPNLENAAQFAGLKVGGMFGIGVHMFFNDFLALQLELRDYIVSANPGGGDVDADRHLCSGQSSSPCNGANDQSVQNNLFVGLGLVFMLPPKAKITY